MKMKNDWMKAVSKWGIALFAVVLSLQAVGVQTAQAAEETETVSVEALENENDSVEETEIESGSAEKTESDDVLAGETENENAPVEETEQQESEEETPTKPVKVSALKGLHVDVRSESKIEVYWKENKTADHYYVYRKQKDQKKYQLLKETGKTSYVDTDVKAGVDYSYKVVPACMDGKRTVRGDAAVITIKISERVNTGHQKYSYSEMKSDLEQLKKMYSRHCQVHVIGKSVQGRNIYDVVIGNPEAEKCFLVVSTLHAREYIASMLCMEQIEYYLKKYHSTVDGRKVSEVLDHIAIHYVVMANPDGVTMSQSGTPLLKNNANGVNLNSNFPYKFGVKEKPGSQFYSGPSAASEPETQAIVALCKSLNKSGLQGVLNYHATGSIVYGSYNGNDNRVKKMTAAMYRTSRETTGYADSSIYSSGGTKSKYSGSFREYVMFKLKKPSITVEIGTTPCPISYKCLPSIWNKNKYLVLREAALFL